MAAKKKTQVRIYVEYKGKKIQCGDVAERIRMREKIMHPTEPIDTLDIYLQPENTCAYYVANGKGGEENRISV